MSKLDELKRRTDRIKQAAEGQWDLIYSQLAPELREAQMKPGRHVTCPFHGGKDDFRLPMASAKHPAYTLHGTTICTCGFRDGWEVLMLLRGWDFPQAIEEVKDLLGGERRFTEFTPAQVKPRVDPVDNGKNDERIKQTLRKWWSETVPLSDASAIPARLYLKNRRLGQVIMPMEDLGFHPGLSYYCSDSKKVIGTYPAIISIVRTASGAVSTVHRTYITANGHKAPVEGPRKLYSSPSTNAIVGGAIKIDPQASPVLHVGEGLESALAARAIIDNADPVWSTVNKELMRSLVVPDYVQLVCIWADRDASWAGQTAACDLMDRVRASGRRAVVMLPPYALPEGRKSIDWNDVVAEAGFQETRNHFHVVKLLRGVAKFKRELQQSKTEGQGRMVV